MDALEQGLIDALLEEVSPLQVDLQAGLSALYRKEGSDTVVTAVTEALETLSRSAGFLELDELQLLCVRTSDLVERVAAATAAPEVLPEAGEMIATALNRLAQYETQTTGMPSVLERLDEALATENSSDSPSPWDADATPEAMVATIGSDMPAEDDLLMPAAEASDEDFLAELVETEEGDAEEDAAVVSEAARDAIQIDLSTPVAPEPPAAVAAPESSTENVGTEVVPDEPEVGGDEPVRQDSSAGAEAAFELEVIDVAEGPIPEDVADFMPDFLAESDEIVERLDEQLVHLENESGDAELLNDIFRAAHTLKGTAGFLGFAQVGDLTHKMETVLDQLRNDELQLTSSLMDVILRAMDDLKILLADIRAGQIVRRDVDAARLDLVAIATTGAPTAATVGPATVEAATVEAVGREDRAPADPAQIPTADDSETVDADQKPQESTASQSPAAQTEQVIRVDVGRVDEIMNLAEELVLGRNRLLQLNTRLGESDADSSLLRMLSEATGQMEMLTGELQESVMTMRMIPVSRVFSRFPRMVRDLARDLDKQIELVIDDGDAEIDKSVSDEIGDPLLHLMRNAVDHGVESPDIRVAAGKPATGTVTLAASHEGNHIVLRIKDDGAGLDAERLKAKALEKGILRPDEAAGMSDQEAFNLIFAPGFSTAAVVTDVSGRGVGMDVVKTNISRLHGTIAIDSELGTGTSVTVRLPLTLAIVGGLQVGCGDEIYLIPLTSVIEAVTIDHNEIDTVQGRQVVRFRDRVLPLIDLSAMLDVPAASRGDSPYVVIVGIAERRVGLLVDHLLGQVDVVIKALGDVVGAATGTAGATILGDGSVALILDIGELTTLLDETSIHDNTPPAPVLH